MNNADLAQMFDPIAIARSTLVLCKHAGFKSVPEQKTIDASDGEG